MKQNGKGPDTLGFVFEEIPMAQAQAIVAAGSGRHAELMLTLTEKLQALDMENTGKAISGRKSFAFSLPNGKTLEPKECKGLCTIFTTRWGKQGVPWKLRYADSRKLFICVPKIEEVKSRGPYQKRTAEAWAPQEPVEVNGWAAEQLVSLARKVLPEANKHGFIRAVSIVGLKLGLPSRPLAAALGVSKDGVFWCHKEGPGYYKTEVETLAKVVESERKKA